MSIQLPHTRPRVVTQTLGGRRRGAKGCTSLLDLSAVCDEQLRELLPGQRRDMPVSGSAQNSSSTLQRRLFHPQVKFRRYPTLGGRGRGDGGHTTLLDLSAVCDEFLRESLPGLRRHMPVSCSAQHFSFTLQRRLFHLRVKFRRYPSLGGRWRSAREHTPLRGLSAVCDEFLRESLPGLRRDMPVSCSAQRFSFTLQRRLFHPRVKFRRYPTLGGRWGGARGHTSLLDLSAVCDEQLRELFLQLWKWFLSKLERHSDERSS